MKRYFHAELEDLRSRLLLMGERSLDIVRLAMQSLEEKDSRLAEQVLEMDDTIDELEAEIDRDAVRYITLRAPVASELRLLTVLIKASHNLERVGDEATSIAKRTLSVFSEASARDLLHLPEMTTLALRMLQQALDSFLREDEETALEICRRDRQVDELNTENYEGLVTELKRHDGNVDPRVLFELAFVSKSLERVGDHATNIAEEVVYLLSGREVRGKGEVQPR